MIEDSLKNARGISRLAGIVAPTYLVFALSVPGVPEVRPLVEDLDQILALQVDAYGESVEAAKTKRVGSRVDELARTVGDCVRSFAGRMHVASVPPTRDEVARLLRFRPEDLVLQSPSTATLAQLLQICADPAIKRDALVFVPEATPLVTSIRGFLDKEVGDAGFAESRRPRMSGWQLAPHVLFGEVEQGVAEVSLSFDLTASGPPFPIFSEQVAGRWESIPETAFRPWLSLQLGADHLLLRGAGERDRALSAVVQELLPMTIPAAKAHVVELERKRSAGDTAIEVGGVSLPGPLAIVGVPVVILVLLLHLQYAVTHLASVRHGRGADFAAFSWPVLRANAASRWLARAMISVPGLVAAGVIAVRVGDLRPWTCIGSGILVLLSAVLTEVVLRSIPSLEIGAAAAPAAVLPTAVVAAPSSAVRYVWSEKSDVYHLHGCPEALRILEPHRREGGSAPSGRRMHRDCRREGASGG